MKTDFKRLLTLFFFSLLFYTGCQECEDCGPSLREPVLSIKFFNIDSLLKVNDTLTVISDSLTNVNQRIQEGDTTLNVVKTSLEAALTKYSRVRNNINQGKILIDEVYGLEGQGPLLFRDSTTNDTLTVFRFPLDMNHDESDYEIHIGSRVDQLRVAYDRTIYEAGDQILMRMFDIRIIETTYDSTMVTCGSDSCYNNETTLSVYF